MLDWYWYPLLFLASALAGCIDTIAGGGGMITLPALLLTGLDPGMALGTNKFQSSFGSFTATVKFVRAGLVHLKDVLLGILWTCAGAMLGTWFVQVLDKALVERIIPWLLVVMIIYILTQPKLGSEDKPARMKEFWFYMVFGLMLGFYDGFFGPGTGSLWAVAFVMVLGLNLMRATAATKVMNFTSNVVSLGLFLVGGNVFFTTGIVMAAGQIVGARIGANLVIRRGSSFIRPVLIAVATAATIKLFYDAYGGL